MNRENMATHPSDLCGLKDIGLGRQTELDLCGLTTDMMKRRRSRKERNKIKQPLVEDKVIWFV